MSVCEKPLEIDMVSKRKVGNWTRPGDLYEKQMYKFKIEFAKFFKYFSTLQFANAHTTRKKQREEQQI